DVKLLLAVAPPRPTRPIQVERVICGKNGAVDGPAFGFELAAAVIGSERVASFAFQHPHAMVLVLAVIGCEVDVPFPADQVQLRSPNGVAVGAERRSRPDARAVVFADGSNGSGFADANALLAFAFAI